MTNHHKVEIIAHRGARNEYPENSLAAIKAAISIPNISGVEFDVELTKDNQPIILHQETIAPNQSFSRLELASRDFMTRDWVRGYSQLQIQQLHYEGCHCPSLADVLNLDWGCVTAHVELKDPTYWNKSDPHRAKDIVKAALPHLKNFSGNLNIISFNPKVLDQVQVEMPGTATTLALWHEWQNSPAEAIHAASRCNAAVVSLADTMVLEFPRWIDLIHSGGLKAHVYPVTPALGESKLEEWNAASQLSKWNSLFKLKVDALVSDFPRDTVLFFNGNLIHER